MRTRIASRARRLHNLGAHGYLNCEMRTRAADVL